VSGKLTAVGDTWQREAGSKQILIIEPGEVYEMYVGSEEVETYYIMFDGANVGRLLNNNGLWPGVFDTGSCRLAVLIELMDAFHEDEKRGWVDESANTLLEVIYNDIKTASPDSLAFEMCSYMQSNWHLPQLTVASLLQEFGVSRTKASGAFKEYAGCTILNYLLDLRLKKAYKMLSEERFNVRMVAERCGFTNASYFSTCFKKKFLLSPRQVQLGENGEAAS
jgi:AraC-like DNA-binding protein